MKICNAKDKLVFFDLIFLKRKSIYVQFNKLLNEI